MKKVLAIIFSLILTGCTSSSLIMLGDKRTPTKVSEIKTYHKEPSASYQEIAKISVSTATGFTEQSRLNSIIAEVKQKAAQLGANAVIFDEPFKTPKLFSDAHVTIKGKAVYIP